MTSLDFSQFKRPVEKKFATLTEHDLYRTEITKDEMWDHYLNSFPEGSNPMFRKRTEHDCSCCRSFIGAVGNAVAIVDNRLVSIWDVAIDEPAYQAVAIAMSKLVKSRPIANTYLYGEKDAGTDKNYDQGEEGKVITWEHFHARIPHGANRGKNYYCVRADIPSKLSETKATHDVLLRGLKELTQDAVDSVLEIIAQNSLYRGAEHRDAVKKFGKLKKKFDELPASQHDTFAWSMIDKVPFNVARIRNTSIGTLLIDLSEGMDLEEAVRKFETSVMAPANYKRPTALVSQKMVDNAKKKVEELGLTSAIEGRRHARLPDVSVNNVIFADRSARKVMRDNVFDGLATRNTAPKNLDKIETVSIEKFIKDIVPQLESIEVMLEGKHSANFVSLIGPSDLSAKPLFKWDNGFSWSYAGDVADSMKERVKRAGGNVTGDLCCRLAWHNYDDLDYHMKEPGGFEVHFRSKVSPHTGGQLDVDMNAGSGTTREPVENIFYANGNKMREGAYKLFVHQWCKRESINVGFEAEIDWLGEVRQFAYEKALRQGEEVVVAKFNYTHKDGIEFTETLNYTAPQKTIWGLKTKEFHRVNVLMRSPNHWDDAGGVGHKHYFFMLDGCTADEPQRGFYTEFLRGDLHEHRKVLELVGARTKVQETPEQLSGLGFSETVRNEITVRVKGNVARLLKVAI